MTCKRSLVRVQCRPPPAPGDPSRSRLSGRRSEETRAIPSPPADRDPLTASPPRSGEPYPLGAHHDGTGTNFSVFSRVAERVELCLFDEDGREERLELPRMTGFAWHGYLPGVGPGQRYGYRVHGPWDPGAGLRCNPAKLLLDPYARAIDGKVRWGDAIHGHVRGHPFVRQDDDSAPDVPRSIVVDDTFDWGDDAPPRVPEADTIIYETHVKGISRRHPDVPAGLQGTYAGLAHPAIVEHLRSLGVTSVELLPVHHFVHDGFLLERGLRQYWGYNSIGYFAPHGEYAASARAASRSPSSRRRSGRSTPRAWRSSSTSSTTTPARATTAGPCSRSGVSTTRPTTGSTPTARATTPTTRHRQHAQRARTLRAATDHGQLRYWITEMRVDGFRFDLASALARELHEVDRLSSFFDIIQQDPVIRTVKLIAEPWDVGEGGYQVGNFPPHWAEWNGHYRDSMRDLWRGEPDTLHDFGRRFTGSADLYADEGRTPAASVNLVTAHDGFTLLDLVTYNRKHNRANGDGNRDGETWNRSWNCGVEGPTDDAEVNRLRTRQRRNLLATLMLSQGVPMLLGGDELGRTQLGNNNGYCHDSDLSWYDWQAADEEMLDFTRRLIALRAQHPVFRRSHWFHVGLPEGADENDARDIEWCTPDGERMSDEDWHTSDPAAIAVYLSGQHLLGRDGSSIEDDSFYLALNAGPETRAFACPTAGSARPGPAFSTRPHPGLRQLRGRDPQGHAGDQPGAALAGAGAERR